MTAEVIRLFESDERDGKVCGKCGERKSLTEFARAAGREDGYQWHCKACARAYYAEKWTPDETRRRHLRRHGIDQATYGAMLAAQEGCCAICRTDLGEVRATIDHDHGTRRIRGLLCHSCNVALGLLKEDPERFTAAIGYLADPPFDIPHTGYGR